jgi:hypothetical protein
MTSHDASHAVDVAEYRPDFLVRLGVMLPCSEQDVKEAYLAKVKHAHPDAGGNQEDFVSLQTDFERALEYSKFHSGRSRWLAESIERYIEQQQLVTAIEARGGRVTLEHIDWLKREVGEDFAQVLDTIAGIRMSGPNATDADIDFLLTHRPMLETLHWLDFSKSKITNQGLAKLASFSNLRKIDLRGTHVGNTVRQLVKALPKLEWLGITGSGLGWFGRFRLRRGHPELQLG